MYLVRFVFSSKSPTVTTNRTKYIRLTTTFHLTLMMTSAQVVETSVTIIDNSPSQHYTHPDDQTTLLHVIPGLKPFTLRKQLTSHSGHFPLTLNPLKSVYKLSKLFSRHFLTYLQELFIYLAVKNNFNW